jgi:hypothetical protein
MTIDPDVLAALERAEYELRDCSRSVSGSASRTAMLQAADFVSATIRKYTGAKRTAAERQRDSRAARKAKAEKAVIDDLRAEWEILNGKVTRREGK